MQTFGILFIAFIAVALVAILVMFMRERARMGIRPFELADAGKAELKRLRHALNPWNVLASLSAVVTMLSITAGVFSIFSPILFPSSGKIDWGFAIVSIGVGCIAGWCARVLAKRAK